MTILDLLGKTIYLEDTNGNTMMIIQISEQGTIVRMDNCEIADKDIKSFDDETLKSLYYIGHIQKKLKPKQATKNKNAKKVAETYAILAKKLGYNKDDFKTTLLDKAGIEVKDMRKKVPNKIKKQIIEVLSK